MPELHKPAVVHLVSSSGFYGSERVVANLCQTLDSVNTLVLCLCSNEKNVEAFSQHITAAGGFFKACPSSVWRALAALRQMHKQEPQLILHAHGYKEIVIACLYAWRYGVRVVMTQHGFIARDNKAKLYNFIGKCFCRWGGVKKVVAVSEAILNIYRDFSVDAARLILLPNGILPPPNVDRPACRAQLFQRLNWAGEPITLAFIGRLSAEKDPLLFVDAFAQLKKNLPTCKGLIIGEGPLRDAVLQRIQHHALEQDLLMLGFVDPIEAILPAIDVLLITSSTEGTPMVLLEAMAAGTIIVSSAVGGIPQVIQHEQNGLLVYDRNAQAFADTCLALINTPERMATLRSAALHTLQTRYDVRRQAPVYLREIYALNTNQDSAQA